MKCRVLICFFLIGMIVLCASIAQGEITDQVYSYSMQLSYSDGNELPPAPVAISDIYGKKIHLQVKNYVAKADRFMLLCFLDGKMIPYEADGKQSTNCQFDIEAAGEKDIDFMPVFDPAELHSGSIMYIVTVGLIDTVPRSAFEIYGLCSCGVAIIIDEDTLEENTIKNENKQWERLIPFETDGDRGLDVYYVENLDDVTAGMGKSMVYGNKEGYDLNIIASGDNQTMALWLFVDDEPYLSGENMPIILYADEGYLYKHTDHLKLSEGKHSVYYVYMSLEADRPQTWNTNKLLVTIGQ